MISWVRLLRANKQAFELLCLIVSLPLVKHYNIGNKPSRRFHNHGVGNLIGGLLRDSENFADLRFQFYRTLSQYRVSEFALGLPGG